MEDFFLAIIYGLLTTIFSVFIALGMMYLLEFPLYSMSALFIIPVGAIAFGLLSSIGYVRAKEKSNYINIKTYITALLFGVIAFFGIQYGEYRMAHVNNESEINYKFEGEHISNFIMDDSTEVIGFFNYNKLKFENGNLSVKPGRGGSFSEGFEVDRDFMILKLILQVIGFLFGAILYLIIISIDGNVEYSSLPKKVKKTNKKRIKKNANEVAQCIICAGSSMREFILLEAPKESYIGLYSSVENAIHKNDHEDLVKFLEKQKTILGNQSEVSPKLTLSIEKCPECNFGYFIWKTYFKESHGYEETKYHRKTLTVSEDFISKVLEHFK
jgi:fumarate reductase subunit D